MADRFIIEISFFTTLAYSSGPCIGCQTRRRTSYEHDKRLAQSILDSRGGIPDSKSDLLIVTDRGRDRVASEAPLPVYSPMYEILRNRPS
jgi:hypothetical protein